MVKDQLVNYIMKNLKKGYTIDSLRFSLISQGYSRITVESAIESANKKMSEHISPIKEKPEIKYKIISDDESINSLSTSQSFFRKLLNKFKFSS